VRQAFSHAGGFWLLAALAFGPTSSAEPQDGLFFQKGVNFTAEFPGGYASAAAVGMLERLPGYGINAVALVPYGFGRPDNPVVRFPGGMERDESIEELARVAHRLGMKVLLKPQLWVRGGYPGDLAFDDPAQRAQWFEQYGLFVDHYARLATRIHADLLAVGVEFVRLTPDEEAWRKLIARARRLYAGPLTYGASQGPEFESIRFWDALDYIGLNNYYPLGDDLSCEPVLSKIETVRKRFRRPVIFTEAGFASIQSPHRKPWDETPRALAPEEQARCYEAVLRAFYRKPWFQGMYWWKIGTNARGGSNDGSHTPWGKPAMEVLSRWYRLPERR